MRENGDAVKAAQQRGAGTMGTRKVLVTGGAGFIGSNLAAHLLEDGRCEVCVFDNLSRKGSQHNAEWLRSIDAGRGLLRVARGDVRDATRVAEAAEDVTEIYHLAAQVAVTTSVDDPRTDFEVNALGTLNVLEAARRSAERRGTAPMVLFTSTNKVYGGLEQTTVERRGDCYEVAESGFCGVSEETPLDFHSPYGCSKGAADQYVRDYARIYDLPTGGLSHVVHLRAAAVRDRGSGVGGALPLLRACRATADDLWRRMPGAGPAACRRSASGNGCGARAARDDAGERSITWAVDRGRRSRFGSCWRASSSRSESRCDA